MCASVPPSIDLSICKPFLLPYLLICLSLHVLICLSTFLLFSVLSVPLSIFLFISDYLPAYVQYLSTICLAIHFSFNLSGCPSVPPSVSPSILLLVRQSSYPFIYHLSIYLSIFFPYLSRFLYIRLTAFHPSIILNVLISNSLKF